MPDILLERVYVFLLKWVAVGLMGCAFVRLWK